MEKEKSIAYKEVLEILKYIPIEKYNLIPEDILNKLKQNCEENYDFTYNIAIPFKEQKISKKARELLKWLDEMYWKSEN